jgi:hypothetical protein
MVTKLTQSKALILLFLLLCTSISPVISAADIGNPGSLQGFSKGISWKPVVPLKKVTFVNYDENSILDDYAYLAAVPTTVFYDKNTDNLISYPLLFYQNEEPGLTQKELSLNAYPGIKYFMDDWMTYSYNQLDQMTLINVPENQISSSWNARDSTIINAETPWGIASQLALQDWSYSDNAVVAVINQNLEKLDMKHTGIMTGSIPGDFKTDQVNFNVPKPEIGVAGQYESFEIKAPYKYVVANMYWENVLEDLDLQLYDDQLGMTDASSNWNVLYGPGEVASSYVYNYGRWEIGVTYMPTKATPPDQGVMEQQYNSNVQQTSLLSTIGRGKNKNTQQVQIDLYPGVEMEVNDTVPYGCRNAEFTLKWNNPSVALGFIVLDTSGAETASAPSNDEIVQGVEEGVTERTIHLDKLGETTWNSTYKICVFTLNDVTTPVDFSIEYSWNQNYTRMDGDGLASATDGSVLASGMNAPLLYTTNSLLPSETVDALYTLGVKHIYLINLGNHLSKDITEKLKAIAPIDKNYVDYKDLYDAIRLITNSNDVVFSTVDPWTYYYSDAQVPVGEYPGSLFIGPAAYIAAHHGTPVLIVDNHPELSQAVVWHTQFWRETANLSIRPKLPTVACMVLTGRNVLQFLRTNGYDLDTTKDNLPIMITVADQFDIGITWDRTFTGALIPGRFCSSPVDTAYWIARTVFYPVLIFQNPALNGPVTLVNGSSSTVIPLIGKLLNPRRTDLVITQPSTEEEYRYPILHTYNVYLAKFNEVGSKHWGGVYTTANGIIPYETPSTNPIDEGTTDKSGAFYPDIDETVVTPIYAEKAGYSNCFSTNFDVTVENLNKGVIMWMESCHGGNKLYGGLSFWDPDSPYVHESNPWRAYERPMLSIGDLHEATQYVPEMLQGYGMPSFATLFKLSRLFTVFLNMVTVDYGSTAQPDTAVMNPELPVLIWDAFRVDLQIKESKGRSLIPLLGKKYRSYGDDGVVIDPSPAGENVLMVKNGKDFDENLTNLHSCGLNAVSCLIANTYLHQVLIRHGTVYQILDPWSTSWYSGVWLQSIPRDIALGKTIGQAYEQGMSEVGIEYLVNQWWWDLNENVLFYGDPSLHVWAPSNEWDYQGNNHWDVSDITALRFDAQFSVDGHMPFGVSTHTKARQPGFSLNEYLWVLLLLLGVLIIVVLAVYLRKRKK